MTHVDNGHPPTENFRSDLNIFVDRVARGRDGSDPTADDAVTAAAVDRGRRRQRRHVPT